MPGRLITFEGGEGSGKSTQLARVAARLRERGIDPIVTREPGGTPTAEGVRTLLLDRDGALEPLAEAFLMLAARADLFARVIAPALDAGRLVLCDRFTDSTLAYQGYGRGIDLDLLRGWNDAATRGRAPDLTLLFDLEVRQGMARREAAGKGNRIDREPIDFHERVRGGYLELARGEPTRIVPIAAAGDPDEVERKAWDAVESSAPSSRTSGSSPVL
jgi:dTMP kinase